jgi:hypothetical protein
MWKTWSVPVFRSPFFDDGDGPRLETTRSEHEVQDTDCTRFSDKLSAVFGECHRVLKDEGLMVFSYHHSREDGWTSVAAAVLQAGFRLVQAQPVKAGMSVAMSKLAAKSPIDLDVLMVCRKAAGDRRGVSAPDAALTTAEQAAGEKVLRFNRTGRRLSLNDVRIVVFSQALVELCAGAVAPRMRWMPLHPLSEIARRSPSGCSTSKTRMVTSRSPRAWQRRSKPPCSDVADGRRRHHPASKTTNSRCWPASGRGSCCFVAGVRPSRWTV